jgi:hypothetical protein
MKIHELAVHLYYPMLNVTCHVCPFPSTTTMTVAPAHGIRGIAGNLPQHPRDKAFVILVRRCHSIPCRIPDIGTKNSRTDKSNIEVSFTRIVLVSGYLGVPLGCMM